MSAYIAGFTVYTLAIIGVIFLAFVVAKKSLATGPYNRKGQYLTVETSLDLAPRKTLHIVRAGDERFLISADVERTTFLTKLNEENDKQAQDKFVLKDFTAVNSQNNILNLLQSNPIKSEKRSMMRGILEKLNA